MNSRGVLIFLGGGVVGGFIGYFFAKYRAQQEIEDIIASYTEKEEKEEKKNKKNSEKLSGAEQRAYGKRVSEEGYSFEERSEEDEELQRESEELFPDEVPDKPYAISYNQFSLEHPDYSKIALSYYRENNVLVNDEEEILDISQVIGIDALNHIGEEEEDMVFVRNDRFGTDYEVQAYDVGYYGPDYEGGD